MQDDDASAALTLWGGAQHICALSLAGWAQPAAATPTAEFCVRGEGATAAGTKAGVSYETASRSDDAHQDLN